MDKKFVKYGNYYYLKDNKGLIDASKAYIRNNNGSYSLYNSESKPYQLEDVVITPKPKEESKFKQALKIATAQQIGKILDSPEAKTVGYVLDPSRHIGAGMQTLYNYLYPNNNSGLTWRDWYKEPYNHPGVLPGSGANAGTTFATSLLPITLGLGNASKVSNGLNKVRPLVSQLEVAKKPNPMGLFRSNIEGVRPYIIRFLSRKFGNGLPFIEPKSKITESVAKEMSDINMKKGRDHLSSIANRIMSIKRGEMKRAKYDNNWLIDQLAYEDVINGLRNFIESVKKYDERLNPQIFIKDLEDGTKGLYNSLDRSIELNSKYPDKSKTMTLIHEDQHAIDYTFNTNSNNKKKEILNKIFKVNNPRMKESALIREKSATMQQLVSMVREYAIKHNISPREALNKLGKQRVREALIDINGYGADYVIKFDDESFNTLKRYINTLKYGGNVNK
jgi:hypothetical protein